MHGAFAQLVAGELLGAAHHITEMFALIERGLLAATADGVTTVLGRAPRTFEDYVVRTAAAGAWQR